MNYELTDKELGKILITPNARAKRTIARRKNGYIQLTVPYGVTSAYILSTIEELKPRLLNLGKAETPKCIAVTESNIIHTYSFSAHIERHTITDKIGLSLKSGKLHISFPQNSDISTSENQNIIRQAVIWGLRTEAKRVLPEKTAHFAKKLNLSYNDIKINSSKTRWGSCSARKNINYSLYLLLLPEKFIDYVVLHELAHTEEMNHSERFWSLLSSFCGCDAKIFSKELKNYKSEWYDFLIPRFLS
jgi:predicted metal-dependent hydrolase